MDDKSSPEATDDGDAQREAKARAYLASLVEYTPHPVPRLTADEAARWPIEAARYGLPKAEIERRLALQRAGADEHNALYISLDHPGPGVEPVEQWHPLGDGVALLLDDAQNPELAFFEHVKRKREEWAQQEKFDRRLRHDEREAQRKREIDSSNFQAIARTPISRAFAAWAVHLEKREGDAELSAKEREAARIQRQLLIDLLPLLRIEEVRGHGSYTPPDEVARAMGLEVYEYRPYGHNQ